VSRAVVTIIVIGHSVRGELERCFASIDAHAELPVRIVYVDNASDDDTLDWVAQAHPEVHVVALAENEGEPARNHGLPLVESPYTMFLDSDAALMPGALRTLVGALESNPSWGLVGPRLVYDDRTLQHSCRRFPPLLLPILRRPPLDRFFEHGRIVGRHLMTDFGYDRTRPVLYLIGACQLFRTSLARSAGPFERGVFFGWSDADWCFQIRDAGGEIVFVADAGVIHSYRRTSRAKPTSGFALRQLRAFGFFQRKYWQRRRSFRALADQLDARATT
jgi:GT2 family glycosyltransferase